MSVTDMLQPTPASTRPHDPVSARRKKRRITWFRLVVIVLILARVMVVLLSLAWSKLTAPRRADRRSGNTR